MSSPDDLTDYLRVTSPSVWAILSAAVVLLVGLIAWACVGTLVVDETRAIDFLLQSS